MRNNNDTHEPLKLKTSHACFESQASLKARAELATPSGGGSAAAASASSPTATTTTASATTTTASGEWKSMCFSFHRSWLLVFALAIPCFLLLLQFLLFFLVFLPVLLFTQLTAERLFSVFTLSSAPSSNTIRT